MPTLQEQLNKLRQTCTEAEWRCALTHIPTEDFTAYVRITVEADSMKDADGQIQRLLASTDWNYTADYIQEQ